MEMKQLNVWIAEEYRNWVADRAEKEQCGMNKIISELIRDDIARKQGEFTQNATIAILQEMFVKEIQQTHAQLLQQLREDRAEESENWQASLKKQVDRLAGLTVHSIRNGGIARRLIYTLLAKAYGGSFAKEVYDHAETKANEELTARKKTPLSPYVLSDDETTEKANNHHDS